MSIQSRGIAAAVTAAVAMLAMGQASAQYYSDPGYGRGNEYGYGHTQRVRCESISSRTSYCRADTYGGQVRITRQLSHSPCLEGRSWGSNSRGVWVSNGCRAEFAISSRHDYRRGDSYGRNGDYRSGRDGGYRSGSNDYRNGYDGYNGRGGYDTRGNHDYNDDDNNDDGDDN